MNKFTDSIVENRYSLARQVGDGRMSHVFLADDLRNPGQQVAFKLLDTAHPDDIRRELFRRETSALERLSHPNIVKLLDHGLWTGGGCFFLALEWLEGSLSRDLARLAGKPMPWEKAAPLLHSLADALVYAHSEGVIHRDIKPANILFDSSGIPKLSDFGISRLRDQLSVGLTLANFLSGGYAAPEQGGGKPGDERSDLYSFGSVSFQLITGQTPPPLGFRPEDVHQLAIDTQLKALLVSLLDPDPSNRPANAGAVRSVFRSLVDQVTVVSPVLMLLTKKAVRDASELGLIDRESHPLAADWLISEYGGEEIAPVSCTLSSDGNVRIIGRNTRLFCTRSEDGACLVVRAVDMPYGPDLEASRRSGLAVRYLWQPVSDAELRRSDTEERRQSEEAIRQFLDRLTTHKQKRQVQHKQRTSRRSLVDVCERLLEMQQRFVDSRIQALAFNGLDIASDMLVVHLQKPAPDDLAWVEGSPMAFFSDDHRGEQTAGQLIEISGNHVYIARDRSRSSLPAEELEFPTTGSIGVSVREHLATLRRQKDAIRRMRSGEVANPRLQDVLSDIRKAEFDQYPPDVEFFQPDLDFDKQEAVAHALSTHDVFIIQGPPGTGKTTVITEILLQIIRDKPDARILVSSQSNVPVNHVLSRIASIAGDGTPEIVRLGRSDKIRQGAERWQLDERVERWRDQVVRHCKEMEVSLRAEARRRNKQIKRLQSAALDEASLSSCEQWLDEAIEILLRLEEDQNQYEALRSDQIDLAADALPHFLEAELSDLAAAIAKRTEEIADHVQSVSDLLPQEFQTEPSGDLRRDIEQLKDAVVSASTTGDASDQTGKVLKLLQDWRTVFGRSAEFAVPILQRANILAATCLYAGGPQLRDQTYDWAIIDEAGRATATELMVPLVRAKRIILVGDERQLPPMLDGADIAMQRKPGDIAAEDLHESLFERLVHDSVKNAPGAIRMLKTQHRMHPAIGELISEVFYDGALTHGISESDRLHGLPWAKRPVLWISTSDLSNHHEISRDTSFSNMAEVEVVTQLLEWMEEDFQRVGEAREIGVIAGYSGQIVALHDSVFPEDRNRWQRLDIEIATVDAFQGRDRDVVIYSTVRSNPDGKLGFLSDPRRLNVALSRARQLLVIVGDAGMFYQAGSMSRSNPFRSVLDYIDTHPEACAQIPWSSSLRHEAQA